MGAEEAVRLVDELVFASTKKHLTDNQRQVFYRSFQGETYPEMAKALHLEPESIKDIGFELWNLLSEVLGEKVTKKNFRAALERAKQLHQQFSSDVSLTSRQAAATGEEIKIAEAVDDLDFVGRRTVIADLDHLVNQGSKIILVHAAGGVGKSKLAYRYLKTQGFDVILELWMAKETQNITSAESVVEEWLRRYLDEEPGREFGVSLERLRQKLRDPSRRIGVLIDNLEPALDKNGKFVEAHRSYVEILRVLTDSETKSVTLITSRERLRESAITLQVYSLEGLDEDAWKQFFKGRGIQVGVSSLNAMHKVYAGNAKAMEILAGAVQSDFAGNLAEYWQANQDDFLVEKDLEDLVASQFDRLQKLNPEAHNLLCRLGCYRYQDVPTIPIEGFFCMLWDISNNQYRRVIKTLQDRSLVSSINSEFCLHPVIRAEAVERLRGTDDWEVANCKAAKYWTESVETIMSIEDAIKALEAQYHYLETNDYINASRIITLRRKNRNNKFECLGACFYMFGLFNQIICVIDKIANKMEKCEELAYLYLIIGDSYWLNGYSFKAIEMHKKSKEIAIESKSITLQILSLLNIGLCKIELLELEEALDLFEAYYSASVQAGLLERTVESAYCLALVHSALGNSIEAKKYVEQVEIEVENVSLNAWSTGYRLLFLAITYKNLGVNEKSLENFHKAISYAEICSYRQVKAKAFLGLAELCRQETNLDAAFSYHIKALELLKSLDAKGDLAEAYFQIGLTYQKIGSFEETQKYWNLAIKIFEKVQAPKQVERVRLSLQNLEI